MRCVLLLLLAQMQSAARSCCMQHHHGCAEQTQTAAHRCTHSQHLSEACSGVDGEWREIGLIRDRFCHNGLERNSHFFRLNTKHVQVK